MSVNGKVSKLEGTNICSELSVALPTRNALAVLLLIVMLSVVFLSSECEELVGSADLTILDRLNKLGSEDNELGW